MNRPVGWSLFDNVVVMRNNIAVAALCPLNEARIVRCLADLFFGIVLMTLFSIARWFWLLLVLAALSVCMFPQNTAAQGGYALEGSEYNVSGVLQGEQVFPKVAIGTSGGYIVWQDNITDASGLGISARKLDSSLSSSMSSFRVNENANFDQQHPSVSLLNGGGAVFVWEGGKQSFQHIYARFLSAGGTWVTGDVLVNGGPTNVFQLESGVTTLTNGNAVVVWSSFNQATTNSMRDVYFQIFTPAGVKVGGETLVNQATPFNQRSASISALSDGRFIVTWVSEQERFENSVDIFGRIYSAAGAPVGSQFLINTGTNVCANPSVARSSDGGFAVAWMQKEVGSTNSWDIFMRPFSGNALGGITRRINTWIHGDQLVPRISAMGTDYMVIWTSMGQDGSRDGVYGQLLRGDGSAVGGEFRVNTTTASQQIQPAVASDGVERFLTVWTSFVGGAGSMDLYGQRYVNTSAPLPPPGAPFVTVLSSNSLAVSWPPVQGLSVAHYEVYADGAATATAVASNAYWNATGLAAGSTHTYRLAYVATDGRRSPLSAPTTNTTYSAAATWGGIPQEWMSSYFGGDFFVWPSPYADSDGDGASNKDEFLRGTDPTNANSVLRQRLQKTVQGMFLEWNTQMGLVYQVWQATATGGPWTRIGEPRFAAGSTDSMYVGGSSAGFYRIERVR